jgi:hypothetical protein
VRLVLLDSANRQFQRADSWWREHRDEVDLFQDEFEAALQSLFASPSLGQTYRRSRRRVVQRWHMPKTQCHVYYVVDLDRDVIEIHAVWGARRRRGPAL